jgi:hypothetical protein
MSFAVAAAIVVMVQTAPLAHSDTVTGADIRAAYSGIVRVEARGLPSGDTVLLLTTPRPPEDHLLYQFHDSYLGWLAYLVHHARSFQLPGLDEPDSSVVRPGHGAAASLTEELSRRLAVDSQFNAVVVPAIAAQLHRSGVPVDPALLNVPRDTVSLDKVMSVAVRFFYPDTIIDDRIYTHVCVGLNAVGELPSRNLALEATAFSAIMAQLRLGDSTQMYTDLHSARDLMARLDSPGPDEVRLLRAQGVTWGAMFRSGGLRQVLLAEVQRMSGLLPFVISQR